MEPTTEVIARPTQDLTAGRNPTAIIAEARERAKALKGIVDAIPESKKVMMNGEQYLELEHWQTCGKFYNLTAQVAWTKPIDVGGAQGWEARADVVDGNTGAIVSSAEAMCLNDEEKWSTRPKYEWTDDVDEKGKRIWIDGKDGKKGHYKGTKKLVGSVPVPQFQLRSMAQTRACAKALRNVLAWVVVLAGYKPTVAEELTGTEQTDKPKSDPIPPPTEAAKPQETGKAAPAAQKALDKAAQGSAVVFVPAASSAKPTKKDGQTRYAIKSPDDVWYSTFDDELGRVAISARENKQKVKVEFEADGEFNNIVSILPA